MAPCGLIAGFPGSDKPKFGVRPGLDHKIDAVRLDANTP